MAEKLKDRFFTRSSVGDMAKSIRRFYPDFNKKRFLDLVFDNLVHERELKEKMHHNTFGKAWPTENDFDPGSHFFSKRHSVEDRSTRRHYPGMHHISIIVNGVEKAEASFLLGGI